MIGRGITSVAARGGVASARMARIGGALLIAIIIAACLTWKRDSLGTSSLKTGDFPGFYVLAEIIKNGQPYRLYDPEYQREVQNRLWPGLGGKFYMSVYPPYTAMVLSPLAEFSPRTARDIWTVGSLFLFGIAVFAAGRQNRFMKDHPWASCGLLLCFAPLLCGVLGGQNTAFGAFVVSSAGSLMFVAKLREKKMPEFLAGAMLGLWLLKPQFGILAGLLLALSTQGVAFAGFLLVGLAFYLVPAASFGFGWPAWWLESVKLFSAQNYISNAAEQISIPGVFNVLSDLYKSPFLEKSLLLFAALFSLIVIIASSYQIKHACRLKSTHLRAKAASDSMFFLAASVCLISPQTLFYDLGIPAICAFRLLDFDDRDDVIRVLLTLVLGGLLVYYRELFPFPILSVFNLGFFILTAKRQAASIV